MKIAFAVDDGGGLNSRISQHFGKCRFFVFVEIENGELKDIKVVENPFASGHTEGTVPEFIAKNGAEAIVSGGMGSKAQERFKAMGIKTIVGETGTVRDVLKVISGK